MDNRYSYYNAHMNSPFHAGGNRMRNDIEASFLAAMERADGLKVAAPRDQLALITRSMRVIGRRVLAFCGVRYQQTRVSV